MVQRCLLLPFRLPQQQRPPRRHRRRLRFSGGVRCWEDCVTLFLFFSRPKAGRFCRGELRSPTGNNNRPTSNNQPARFLGIWGDFWVIWAHAMRPYGFLGGWAHAMRPYGFFGVIWAHAMRPYGFWGNLGYLGARDAPLRVLDAAEGEKPPHQVNLDTFREKIFLYRESLK